MFLKEIKQDTTGYNFGVFNNLRHLRDRKKAKVRSSRKLPDIRYSVLKIYFESKLDVKFQNLGIIF